jgi:hypothetical protein
MSDESQIQVPASFVALFIPEGRVKPVSSRQEIADRHEICEDLATALLDKARTVLRELGVTEKDVLHRIHRVLREPASGISSAEALWVTRRLAEMLECRTSMRTPKCSEGRSAAAGPLDVPDRQGQRVFLGNYPGNYLGIPVESGSVSPWERYDSARRHFLVFLVRVQSRLPTKSQRRQALSFVGVVFSVPLKEAIYGKSENGLSANPRRAYVLS